MYSVRRYTKKSCYPWCGATAIGKPYIVFSHKNTIYPEKYFLNYKTLSLTLAVCHVLSRLVISAIQLGAIQQSTRPGAIHPGVKLSVAGLGSWLWHYQILTMDPDSGTTKSHPSPWHWLRLKKSPKNVFLEHIVLLRFLAIFIGGYSSLNPYYNYTYQIYNLIKSTANKKTNIKFSLS